MATAMTQALCPVRVQVRCLRGAALGARSAVSTGLIGAISRLSLALTLAAQVKQTVAARRCAVVTRAEAGESRRSLLTGLVAGA